MDVRSASLDRYVGDGGGGDSPDGRRPAGSIRHLRRLDPDPARAAGRVRRPALPDPGAGRSHGGGGAGIDGEGGCPDRGGSPSARGRGSGRRRLRGPARGGGGLRGRQRRRLQHVLVRPRRQRGHDRRQVQDVDPHRPAERPAAADAPGPRRRLREEVREPAAQRRHGLVARGGRTRPVRRHGDAAARGALPRRLRRGPADGAGALQQLSSAWCRPPITSSSSTR